MPGPYGPSSGKFMQLRHTLDQAVPAAVIESTVRDWTLNDSQTSPEKRNAATAAGTARVAGIKDFTGTFNGDGGRPPLMPGDKFYFEGYTAPHTGVYNTPGVVYHGNAIIESVDITWDFTENGELLYTANFAGASVSQDLGKGGANAKDPCLEKKDDTIPHPPADCPTGSMCGLLFEYSLDECPLIATGLPDASTATWTTWANITTATLTLTTTNPSSVNSSSNCCTDRDKGPLDWTLTISEEEQDTIIAKSTVFSLKLYTDPTNFWLLRFAYLNDYANITANKFTGDFISKDANIMMQACCENAGTSALGHIAYPGASYTAADFPATQADVYWPDGYTAPA